MLGPGRVSTGKRYVTHAHGTNDNSERSVAYSLSVDDVFDSRCRIGQMAGQITTRLGTVTLQVVTSSSSES